MLVRDLMRNRGCGLVIEHVLEKVSAPDVFLDPAPVQGVELRPPPPDRCHGDSSDECSRENKEA